MHEPDGAAAIADRPQQPRDEIAVHGSDVAAGAILQQPYAIDDDINAMIGDQPRQRGRIQRQQRHLKIERACLLRR
jgi:hypothetical protein